MQAKPVDPAIIYTAVFSGHDSCWGFPTPISSCCPDSCCAGESLYYDTSALDVPIQLTSLYEPKRLNELAQKINVSLKKWNLSRVCILCSGFPPCAFCCLGLCYLRKRKSALKDILLKENADLREQGLEWQVHPPDKEISSSSFLSLRMTAARISYEAANPGARRLTQEVAARAQAQAAAIIIPFFGQTIVAAPVAMTMGEGQ